MWFPLYHRFRPGETGKPVIDSTRLLPGKNSAVETAPTEDTDEHGPFTAGIFSAAKDNGIGIAGVVPEVTIIPIKTFTEANGVLHQITLFCFPIREAIDSRYRFHPWRGAENRSRLAL